VEVFVGDRIALDFLQEGKGFLGLVGPGEFDENSAAGDRFQEADKLRTLDGERLRAGVLPIENRGDAIDFAEAAGSTPARSRSPSRVRSLSAS